MDRETAPLPAELPPPPPGAALKAALAELGPVRTRVPGRSFVAVLAVGLVSAGIAIGFAGLRPDARALPLWWVVGMGALWAVAAPLLLARSIMPRPGQVLPDADRAGRSALVVALAMVLLGLFASRDAPGVSLSVPFGAGYWHCTKTALRITVPVLLAAGLVLRHLHPMGAGRLGAALGAAGGACAGFALHVLCPVAGGAHAGLAHGGATVIGAILGAAVLGRFLR
jgi:hypothetical protein